MKKTIFVMLTALSLGMATPLFAADTSKSTSISKDDAAAVQKGVQELGKLFEIEPKKKEPDKAPTEATSVEKTVAQVMDKAIDKVSDVVGAMAQAIDKIAPEVWRIMLRQQYARAIMACVVPIGLLIVILTYMRLVGKYWKPEMKNDDLGSDENTEWAWRMALVRVIPTILACLAGLWFFNRLADSISLLINPEFYAIQDLLRMILNKGM